MRLIALAELRRLCRSAGSFLCALSLAGCAIVYEKDGVRHTTGFVHIRQPVAVNDDETAGDALSVSTIGFGLMVLPSGTIVTLGYSNDTLVALKDNKLVCGQFMEGGLSVEPVYRCHIEGDQNEDQEQGPSAAPPQP